jgi:hypothetical protein
MLMQTVRSFRSTPWILLVVLMLFIPTRSYGQVVGISITVAPPALPVYEQPICPADNYIWTPGYWAYSEDDADYYFVPGTWVEAPTPGFLWTPGYWGWNDGVYVWNGGYWGPQIGFYGGVNYGFGYGGTGYEGGYWQGGNFFYNRSVSNVNVTVIHNVYSKTVINDYSTTGRASFNGPGGTSAKPSAQQESYAHEQHTPPTATQTEHQHAAVADRSQFASVNHGKPTVAATAKPGEFKGAEVVPAKAAAPYKGATGKEATKGGGAKTANGGAAARNNAPHTSTSEHGAEHPNGSATSERNSTTPGEKSSTPSHATTAHTETTPKTATPRTTTPRTESTPKAQPQHEAAPKPEPQHEAAPKSQPQHQAPPTTAPKPESKPEEKPKS